MKKINNKLLLVTLSTIAIASVGTVATLSAKNKSFLKKEFALIGSLDVFVNLREGQNIEVSNSIGQEEWVYTLNGNDFNKTANGEYTVNYNSASIRDVLHQNKPSQYFNIIVPRDAKSFKINQADKTSEFFQKVRYLDLSRTTQLKRIENFSNLPGLLNVYLSGNETSIVDSAFENCPQFTQINNLISNNKLTSIGNSAFKGTAISTLFIPDSVTTIGNNAFANMNNLQAETLNLPDKFNTHDEFVRLGLTTGTGNALGNLNFQGTSFSGVEFDPRLIDPLKASSKNVNDLAKEFNSKPLYERLRYIKEFSMFPPDVLVLREVAFRDLTAKLIALPNGNAKMILDAKLNSLYKSNKTSIIIKDNQPANRTTFTSAAGSISQGVHKLNWKVSNKNFDNFKTHLDNEVRKWNSDGHKDDGFNTGPMLKALKLHATNLPINSELTFGQLTQVGADKNKYNFTISLKNILGATRPIILTFEINFYSGATPPPPKPPVEPDPQPNPGPDTGGDKPTPPTPTPPPVEPDPQPNPGPDTGGDKPTPPTPTPPPVEPDPQPNPDPDTGGDKPTPPTPNPDNGENNPETNKNVGVSKSVIVGAVVGTTLSLLLVMLIVFFFVKRKKAATKK